MIPKRIMKTETPERILAKNMTTMTTPRTPSITTMASTRRTKELMNKTVKMMTA
jgi:hypothetical protein